MRWQAAILATLLLLTCSRANHLRLAVLPNQSARGEAAYKAGMHDLYAITHGLEQLGHMVTVIDRVLEESIHHTMADAEGALFDVVLAQGESAQAVADFAAHLGIPVIRFVADSRKGTKTAPEPLFERPAALIFATQEDMTSFNDVMEETVRMVISPFSLKESLNNPDVHKIATAAQTVVQTIHNSLQPAPLEQKTLGLVMIVKNEVATINLTLASMRNMIDYWTIVDTGSTDGTQDAIRKYMVGYPGVLIEEPFVDFSTTRNFALQVHGNKTAYAFMPDADFVVNNPWRLRLAAMRMQRECLHRSIPACAKAVQIRLYSGSIVYYGTRLFPTQGIGTEDGWRYLYPVHESPSHLGLEYMNAQHSIGNVIRSPVLSATKLPVTHNKSRTRWKDLDLPLLTAEHKKKPKDTRIVFYLAQTLDLVGDLPAALAMYQKRIDMGGWQQEVFEAHMRRGRIKYSRMPPGTDPRPDFLRAHRLFPKRAEPLIWMSWHHYNNLMKACKRGDPGTEVCRLRERVAAYYYARKAAALPMPEEGLFIDKPVYDHQSLDSLVQHAFHTTKHLGNAHILGHNAAKYVQDRKMGTRDCACSLKLYQNLAVKW